MNAPSPQPLRSFIDPSSLPPHIQLAIGALTKDFDIVRDALRAGGPQLSVHTRLAGLGWESATRHGVRLTEPLVAAAPDSDETTKAAAAAAEAHPPTSTLSRPGCRQRRTSRPHGSRVDVATWWIDAAGCRPGDGDCGVATGNAADATLPVADAYPVPPASPAAASRRAGVGVCRVHVGIDAGCASEVASGLAMAASVTRAAPHGAHVAGDGQPSSGAAAVPTQTILRDTTALTRAVAIAVRWPADAGAAAAARMAIVEMVATAVGAVWGAEAAVQACLRDAVASRRGDIIRAVLAGWSRAWPTAAAAAAAAGRCDRDALAFDECWASLYEYGVVAGCVDVCDALWDGGVRCGLWALRVPCDETLMHVAVDGCSDSAIGTKAVATAVTRRRKHATRSLGCALSVLEWLAARNATREAAEQGDCLWYERWLFKRRRLPCDGEYGVTALYLAVGTRPVAVVRALLRAADADLEHYEGSRAARDIDEGASGDGGRRGVGARGTRGGARYVEVSCGVDAETALARAYILSRVDLVQVLTDAVRESHATDVAMWSNASGKTILDRLLATDRSYTYECAGADCWNPDLIMDIIYYVASVVHGEKDGWAEVDEREPGDPIPRPPMVSPLGAGSSKASAPHEQMRAIVSGMRAGRVSARALGGDLPSNTLLRWAYDLGPRNAGLCPKDVDELPLSITTNVNCDKPMVVYMARMMESRGVEMNVPDTRGRMGLMRLITLDQFPFDLAKWFPSSDVRDRDGNNALHHACRDLDHSRDSIVRWLLGRLSPCSALDSTDRCGRAPLHVACEFGRTRAAEMLVAHGADVNARSADIMAPTPLLAAIGHAMPAIDMIRLLCAGGADLNIARADGRTALHLACERVLVDTTDALITAGADVNAHCVELEVPPPLIIALSSGSGSAEVRDAVASRLLAAGADPNIRRSDGRTALHLVCQRGCVRLAAALVSAGADVNASSLCGETPVVDCVRAARQGVATALQVLQLLAVAHATASGKLRLGGGITVLHLAAAGCPADVMRTLLSMMGADVKVRDARGRTALHACVAHALAGTDMVPIMSLLLDAGADVSARDDSGVTPLDLARDAGCAEAVRWLEACVGARSP